MTAAEDVELFDPLDPAFLVSPFATLARLRAAQPVWWHDQLRAWVVLRHTEARQVLTDHLAFAADPRRAGLPLAPEQVSIQSTDPPDQLPARTALAHAIRQLDLDEVGRRAATHVEERLTAAGDRGTDAAATVVGPVVALATTDLLGLPAELAPEFAEANRAIVRAMMSGLDPAAAAPGRQARATVNRLVVEWLPRARTGLLGALQDAPGAADLDPDVLASSVRVLLLSSLNSTSSLIGLALVHLLETSDRPTHGRAAAFLAAPDPAVAVHELIRFDGPAQAAGRFCTQDTRLGGRPVRRGDQVLLMLAAVNRDPEQFVAPDELRLDRQPNPHLGFGRGAHHCIGTQPALTLAASVLGALCRSGWRLDGERPPELARNPALRSLSRLPILPPT